MNCKRFWYNLFFFVFLRSYLIISYDVIKLKMISLRTNSNTMRKIYLLLTFFIVTVTLGQNPADIDPTFNYKPNKVFVNRNVNQCVTQSDGRIIMVGNFDGYYLGSGSGEFIKCKYNILRLNSDQTIDPTFRLDIPQSSNPQQQPVVKSIGIQSNGKIVANIANFPVPDDSGFVYGCNVVARFNLNGSLDTTFSLGFYNCNGNYLKILNNDKILHDESNYIKRLNADGSEDSSFTQVNVTQKIFNIAPDGSIYVCDRFGTNIQKFSSNGVFDNVFYSNMSSTNFNCTVNTIDVQSDGKILIGGRFNAFNNTTVTAKQLIRLNANGTLDTTFAGLGFTGVYINSCDNQGVTSVKIQPDGKILVGGEFIKYGTTTAGSLIRLNPDGSIDASFNVGNGFKSDVTSLVLQSNGDVWVLLNANGINYTSTGASNSYGEIEKFFNDFKVGLFLKLDTNGNLLNEEKDFNFPVESIVKTNNNDIVLLGESRFPYNRGIKRINNDGIPIFNNNLLSGFNKKEVGEQISTQDMVIQPDGKMVVCGYFTKYNNTTANGLIRLNSDYSIDTSFNIGTGFTTAQGRNAELHTLAIQSDGKILLSGYFDFFNGIPITNSIIRINPDGTLDSSFIHSGGASKIIVLADGKILTNNGNLKRLNTDGSVDLSFSSTAYVADKNFALQSDGKIVYDGGSYIGRLNSDGSDDLTFNGFGTNYINTFKIQTDDKILISTSSSDGGKLIRLNSNGLVDLTFNSEALYNGAVNSILIQSDGKILAGGNFTRYNGAWCNGIVRLLGGDAHLIKGISKFDFNNNGCDDSDINFPNMKFNLVSGTSNVTLISNNLGEYFIPLPTGSYTLTPSTENPNYGNVSPTHVVVNFPADGNVVVQDFCITPNGVHPDLEVVFIPLEAARPGFDAKYKLVYKNKGNQLHSGSVTLNFNDAVLDYVSATPSASTSSTNIRTWNYTNLYPYETREILVKLNLNSPMETPPLNGGSVLNYTTTITSAQIDETPNDNTFILNQTVVNSYDPNDKTCTFGPSVGTDKVGKYAHYVIRFENSGTYNAQNINVTDVVDTNKFDISTLVPLSGSALFTTKISGGNKVEFKFDNINLPYSTGTNKGYVAFKIKTKATLVAGDTFGGLANIYFDYNYPITTNTYTTTIQALSVQDFTFSNYFSLYPNPVNDILNINKKSDIEISSINIYNTLGQLVMTVANAKNINSIDVSNFSQGNYFVKINSDKGTSNTRFIKK